MTPKSPIEQAQDFDLLHCEVTIALARLHVLTGSSESSSAHLLEPQPLNNATAVAQASRHICTVDSKDFGYLAAFALTRVNIFCKKYIKTKS